MKKLLLTLAAVLMACAMNAQTVVLNEGFDSGIPTTWTMFSDGKTPATNMLNAGFTADAGWTYFSENGNPGGMIGSTSWFNPVGKADRWIITDALTIPQETGFMFTVDCKAPDAQNADGFLVLVSTTSDTGKSCFTDTILNVSAAESSAFKTYAASLDSFAGQTIHIALVNPTNDKFILYADNMKVFKPLDEQIELADVSTPSILPMGSSISVKATIINRGKNPLTNFQATYTVNGNTSSVMNITGLNLAYGDSYTFTHEEAYTSTSEAGNYTFTVNVTMPNGQEVAMVNPDNVSSSTAIYDPATATNRMTLLEEFSTAKCQYCPMGAQLIAQALPNISNKIWIVHHAGFYTDDLTISANEKLMFLYGSNGTYAPAYMVDRTRFNSGNPGPVDQIQNADGIISTLNTSKQVPSFVNIAINDVAYDADSRKVTGTVSGNFTSPIYNSHTRITVYVIEDSIIMAQSSTTGTISNYCHMNAVRACITGDWGNALSVNGEGRFTYNIDYTLGSGIVPEHCRLVAIVNNYNSSDANDCAVLNATMTTSLSSNSVAVDDVAQVELNTYPNPANDCVNIFVDNNIRSLRLVNVMGQEIYANSNVNADAYRLNTANYPAGIYLLTVVTDNGTSTKRISITH